MNIRDILTTPPVATGGQGKDLFTVVVLDEPGGSESWYFIDYGGPFAAEVTLCSGEAEAMSRFEEADCATHRPGCRCTGCADPWLEDRRRTVNREREWA